MAGNAVFDVEAEMAGVLNFYLSFQVEDIRAKALQ
jgi:hypothetical protein